jgi:hypothetical protein
MAGDVFDKICIETAIDAVQTKVNQTFADLDLSLLDETNAKKQLDAKKLNQIAGNRSSAQIADTPPVIDVNASAAARPKTSVR